MDSPKRATTKLISLVYSAKERPRGSSAPWAHAGPRQTGLRGLQVHSTKLIFFQSCGHVRRTPKICRAHHILCVDSPKRATTKLISLVYSAKGRPRGSRAPWARALQDFGCSSTEETSPTVVMRASPHSSMRCKHGYPPATTAHLPR